jgi:hypothetical protein
MFKIIAVAAFLFSTNVFAGTCALNMKENNVDRGVVDAAAETLEACKNLAQLAADLNYQNLARFDKTIKITMRYQFISTPAEVVGKLRPEKK